MTTASPGGHNGGAGAERDEERDFYGPEHRTSLRGVIVVAAAFVLCILLLPSGTRAPSAVPAEATVATPTTVPPAHRTTSTTTAPPHGHGATSTTTIPAPATVHVLVANGTTTNGVAGAVTTYLGQKGYGTLTAANALTRVTGTQIYPTGGSTAAAQEVAQTLGLPVSTVQAVGAPAPVPSSSGATVVVIAGPDLAARFAPSAQG
ncbi:MAG TPA: LytR C-terminal domain-containing protein [Acidimicrobiales bacterium]|nr:LytR C-terminal domain-containing protein [Acidimicrobiales bacterium]